ncbi:disulfide bond formation protein B [Aquihabitans daechungensis]|uniref:disulfide bond formation protein B n=1 Tax=Aquihabitans daechungensis TaxID=1052257 RepID=UPI003BA115AE
MDTDVVTLFFALLATFAQLVVVAAVLLWLGSLVSPAIARVKASVLAVVGPQALTLAAVVALVCTLGSLYLSEVAHFPPCRLCWFQRIAMYPLVVVLGVGAIRRDVGARISGAILAGLGACVSVWHLLVERYPTLESDSCDPLNPCSMKWVEELGYLTIPGMALSGFALILVLLAAARPVSLEEQP